MEEILTLLERRGPLTGKELVKETGLDIFRAWKKCSASNYVINFPASKRYLRLDKKVDGYARLSPSIMREFLNYTVVGLKEQRPAVESMVQDLHQDIAAISTRKMNLARDTVLRIIKRFPDSKALTEQAVFIIAGDVVFNMSHSEPRPEFSTGELVRGSDLDLIVVTDNLAGKTLKEIDRIVYDEKYSLLINPASKEELDYIIKNIDTVVEQLRFDSFKNMVASKILHEGLYLGGSERLFNRIKEMLEDFGIGEKLEQMEKKAVQERAEAEMILSSARDSEVTEELMSLFYTTEEKEEIF